MGSGRRPCSSRGRREDGAAHWGRVRVGPSTRGPCAADGGTAARRPPVLRHLSAGGCRAGYRSAEDLLDTTPQRLGDHLRQLQMVEQLVHVPTVVTYSSLQQLTAEQIVDIPVPGCAGEGGRGGLQGFAGQSSTASSSHVGAADGAGQGVFRTFPRKKKVRSKVRTRSELGADFNPSTLSAHQMPPEQARGCASAPGS